MQIKEVKPINFLFFRTETKVQELANYFPVGQALIKEALANNVYVTGPVHWHYKGFSGDESKPFTLEVSVPVSDIPKEYDGEFHFKRTEPFKCVSIVHEGSWMDIPQSYGKIMEFVTSHQLTPTAMNREVYINADFQFPEANVTEIQLGVQ